MKDCRIACRLLLLWLLLAAYVTVHEAGHAIMAVTFGAELNYFSTNLLDARVFYDGRLTSIQTAIVYASGAGLPMLLWLIFIITSPTRPESRILEYIKVFSIVVPFSLLAWVVIPIMYIRGNAPAGDDVTKFISASGVNALLVSVFSLALVITSFLIWKKKNPEARKVFFFRDAPFAARKSIVILSFFAVLSLVLMTFPWVNHAGATQGNGTLLCSTALGGLEGEYEMCKFWVEPELDPEQISIIITLQNAAGELLNLELEDPRGDFTTLVNYRDFSVGSGRQSVKLDLPPGEYRVMMNAIETEGRIAVYLERDLVQR